MCRWLDIVPLGCQAMCHDLQQEIGVVEVQRKILMEDREKPPEVAEAEAAADKMDEETGAVVQSRGGQGNLMPEEGEEQLRAERHGGGLLLAAAPSGRGELLPLWRPVRRKDAPDHPPDLRGTDRAVVAV